MFRYSPIPIRYRLLPIGGAVAGPAGTATCAWRARALLRGKVRQQWRLRPDHGFERIACAHLFTISGVALVRRNAANADGADELSVDDDGKTAFLRRQTVAGHVLVG